MITVQGQITNSLASQLNFNCVLLGPKGTMSVGHCGCVCVGGVVKAAATLSQKKNLTFDPLAIL